MNRLGHIAVILVLAAGFIYFVMAQKDDAQMVDFKAKAAAFVRSGKKSAPLRDVLGRGGDKICIKSGGDDSIEITIQDYKVLTVMKGRRDVIVDGKPYALTIKGDCTTFAGAVMTKQDSALLISGKTAAAVKPAAQAPKQKNKPAPAPEKKKPAPRSYGY